MIQLSNQEEREAHFKSQKAKIAQAYSKNTKTATVLTKAEFEEQFPAEKFEIFTLGAVDKFRNDLNKAEDIEDKEGAFKNATSDLKAFVVHSSGKESIMFVRDKVKGE